MDAVILANFFHQHAPLAIRALKAGKHVMSETTACKTPAEGVTLARAVEKSGRIYMLAENFPFFVYNQEMRRLYQAGEIGEMQFGEGDFNRAPPAKARLATPGVNHWRNHVPATYYCTHGLAPIMYITDTRPVSVNALCIPYSPEQQKEHIRRGDCASVILCRMDNGAVVALLGTGLHGHRYWYRIHGTHGLMENLRTGNRDMLRISHEKWALNEADVPEKIYLPEFPFEREAAGKTSHGGADFFTSYYFAEAIRRNRQPYLDVYRALDMSLVGIQAYRSALAEGAPFTVPDFRKEGVRRKYAKDDWSPFPEDRRAGQPYPSVKGRVIPTKEALAHARKIWHEKDYHGE
jgi:predicted dehydrogenase